MISLDTLQDISSKLKSGILSDLQSLSTLGKAIYDSWTDMTSNLDIIGGLVASCTSSLGTTVQFDDLLIEHLLDLYTGGNAIFSTIAGLTPIQITIVQDELLYDVLVNGDQLCYFNPDSHYAVLNSENKDRLLQILRNHSEKLANTCGMYYAMADICTQASAGDWLANNGLATTLTALVQQYSSVLGSMVSDALRAIAQGPRALLQLLTGVYSKVKTALDNNDLSSLLSSTSIVLNQFAAGIVATTIGTVITAVGTVVMAFSRIAGTVVSVLGMITTVIGRIVTSATTAFDDTQYKVQAGSDVVHCFSFVIGQGTYTSAAIANYMRNAGWVTMTVVVPHQAAVYMMYLQEYDSATNNTLVYEVHLSSDVDITTKLDTFEVPSSGGVNIPFVDVGFQSSAKKPLVLSYLPYYTDADGNFIPCFWLSKVYGDGGTTLPSAYAGLRNSFGQTTMWSPCDYSLLDVLKQWYSNDLKNFFDVRLCSALIINIGGKLNYLYSQNHSSVSSGDEFAIGFKIHSDSYSDFTNHGIAKLHAVYYYAWRCFVNGDGIASTSWLMSSFGLTDTLRDYLLAAIQACYDGLNYQTDAITDTVELDMLKATGSGGSLSISTTSTSQGNWITIDVDEHIRNPGSMFVSIQPNWVDSVDEFYNTYATGVWNQNTSLSLPTLTFSGFIAGLIVDGLIILAATAVTVAAVTGWLKIRNYRAQLQAQAEAAWYEYADGGQNAYQWQQYKSARFKYNLLALATGGTTLSLGLYDDGSSVGDVIQSLRGSSHNGDVEDNELNLDYLAKLIAG